LCRGFACSGALRPHFCHACGPHETTRLTRFSKKTRSVWRLCLQSRCPFPSMRARSRACLFVAAFLSSLRRPPPLAVHGHSKKPNFAPVAAFGCSRQSSASRRCEPRDEKQRGRISVASPQAPAADAPGTVSACHGWPLFPRRANRLPHHAAFACSSRLAIRSSVVRKSPSWRFGLIDFPRCPRPGAGVVDVRMKLSIFPFPKEISPSAFAEAARPPPAYQPVRESKAGRENCLPKRRRSR